MQLADIDIDLVNNRSDATPIEEDSVHGTLVAGEIAMEKGNGFCGVGIAYNSFITGKNSSEKARF